MGVCPGLNSLISEMNGQVVWDSQFRIGSLLIKHNRKISCIASLVLPCSD